MKKEDIKKLIVIIQGILLLIQFGTGTNWLCIPIVLLMLINLMI